MLNLRAVRQEYNISLLQFALVLETPCSQVQIWEVQPPSSLSENEVRLKIEVYLHSGRDVRRDNNVLFGVYPISIARQLLLLSLEEIAKLCGYTSNSWKKIEANTRPVRHEVMNLLEELIKTKLVELGVFQRTG